MNLAWFFTMGPGAGSSAAVVAPPAAGGSGVIRLPRRPEIIGVTVEPSGVQVTATVGTPKARGIQNLSDEMMAMMTWMLRR